MRQFNDIHDIGVIADTHGLLRPEALHALEGSDLIIHAGDAGKRSILERLQQIAPLVTVRGNIDRGEWAEELPETETVIINGIRLYVIHDLARLEIDPVEASVAAVIFAHSHQPKLERKNGILYLNPGSAGPRRFSMPVCLGRLQLRDGQVLAELRELPV